MLFMLKSHISKPEGLSNKEFYGVYTGHWEKEKRRKETKEWLRRREQELN
jgi:hypothetical protein